MNHSDVSGHDWDENTYLHAFEIPLSCSPPPEPSPSHVSHGPEACTLFQTVAQEIGSETSEDKHDEIQDKVYQDTYVHFKPDVKSDSTNSDIEEEAKAQFSLQDKRLHLAEEAQDLEDCQELDNLGLHIFSQRERDNLKAATYKVTHHVTRDAFEGLQHLTESCMDIGSDFVANRILEKASKLRPDVYDCCANSCMCYTGEFAQLTECSICGKPRLDKCRKVQNQFQYIPIIPRLQAIYKDPNMIKLLLY